MRTTLFCICCLLLLSTLPAFAQDAQLSGLITDTSKAVVSGAKLSIANKDTGVTRSAESNNDGYYSAPALPAGTYMITVQVKGFERQWPITSSSMWRNGRVSISHSK